MKSDLLAGVSAVSGLVALALSMAYSTCVGHPYLLGDGKAKRVGFWCVCFSLLTAFLEFVRFVGSGGVLPLLCGLLWAATALVWKWLCLNDDDGGMSLGGGARSTR